MKKVSSIIGTCTGALSIIFSFVINGYSTGRYEENLAYGGDAYTGIQNAAAGTAVNVHYLSEIIKFGLFAVLLIAGLALLSHYAPMMIEELGVGTAGKANGKPAENAAPEQKAPEQKAEESAIAGASELSKYKDLLDNGVITEEEYAAKAREIMGTDDKLVVVTGAEE